MTQRMMPMLAFLLLVVSGWAVASPSPWPGPWDPATEAAAEFAVAQLGAKRGLDVRATVLDVQATVLDVQATVLETPGQREVAVGAGPDVGSKPPDDKGPRLGVASGPHSTMSSDVLYLPAHPDAVATLTIRVADQQGQPLPGKHVQVASALSGGPADTIIQPEAPTDARGFTTARVRPTIPLHTARFSARVLEDNVDIGQVVEIEVQAPAPPSFFPPAFAPYFDEKHFVVSPTPLKVGQPTTITVPLTNVRKVPVEVRVRFFSNVLNIGLGHWPQIGETDTFVLQPGESRAATITWIPTVESGHQCMKVEVWGRELPSRSTAVPWRGGLPLVRTAAAQTPVPVPAPTPTATPPVLMDSRQQNVGPVTPRKKKCDDGELCAQLGAAVKAVKKGIAANHFAAGTAEKPGPGRVAVKPPFKANAVKALENVQQNACTDASLAAAINSLLKSLANLKEKPVTVAEVVENNHILKEIKDELCTIRQCHGLNLGKNKPYTDHILKAAKRSGLDPAALASLIDAEAAKDSEGVWNPASANPGSSARGLTQFLKGTWRDMARKPGTLLNEKARERGLIDENNKVVAGKEQELLDLRFDPELSIVTAAEYAQFNLAYLEKQGLISDATTDDEKARLAYLAHHDGPQGAEAILNDTMSESTAETRLTANVDGETAKKLKEEHGTWREAYKAWINSYIDKKIKPDNFRTTSC